MERLFRQHQQAQQGTVAGIGTGTATASTESSVEGEREAGRMGVISNKNAHCHASYPQTNNFPKSLIWDHIKSSL